MLNDAAPFSRATSFSLPLEIAPDERVAVHATLVFEPEVPDDVVALYRNEVRLCFLRLAAQIKQGELLIESTPPAFHPGLLGLLPPAPSPKPSQSGDSPW